jgi:hypothetical protein
LSPAGDWTGQGAITLNIVGGTGDYASVTGGTATFTDSNIDLMLIKCWHALLLSSHARLLMGVQLR